MLREPFIIGIQKSGQVAAHLGKTTISGRALAGIHLADDAQAALILKVIQNFRTVIARPVVNDQYFGGSGPLGEGGADGAQNIRALIVERDNDGNSRLPVHLATHPKTLCRGTESTAGDQAAA